MEGEQRIICVASGKGGVGKTSISLNLSFALSQLNKKVCIIDADLGLANINIILGIEPRYTVDDLIFRNIPLDDVIFNINSNIDLLPGGSGIYRLANLSAENRRDLMEKFKGLKGYDFLIIDNSPGISSPVISFCLSSKEVLVVVTPEPTSIADGYALIKTLKENGFFYPPLLILNKIRTKRQAVEVSERLKSTCKRFLGISVVLIGIIPEDRRFGKEMELNIPFLRIYPEAEVSRAFFLLANRIVDRPKKRLFSISIDDFWKKNFIQSLGINLRPKDVKSRLKRIGDEIEEIILDTDFHVEDRLEAEVDRIINNMMELKFRIKKIKIGILTFDMGMKKLLSDILKNHFSFDCVDLINGVGRGMDELEIDIVIMYLKNYHEKRDSRFNFIFVNVLEAEIPLLIIKDFLNNGFENKFEDKKHIKFLKAPFDITDLHKQIVSIIKNFKKG